MPISDRVLALALGSAAASVLLAVSPLQEQGQSGHRLQIQSGPIALELGGATLVRLRARSDCLDRACPWLALSYQHSTASQGAPGESHRIETCQSARLERGWFIAERADEGLGEQGRVCKPASAETA